MRGHVVVNGIGIEFESTPQYVWAAWFYGNESAFWVRGPVKIYVQKIVDVGSTERQ